MSFIANILQFPPCVDQFQLLRNVREPIVVVEDQPHDLVLRDHHP